MKFNAQNGDEPSDGDIVEIAWERDRTKRAVFRRWRKTGNAIVRVEQVNAKGEPLGTFGADRDVMGWTVLRVLAVRPAVERKGGAS